MLDSAGKRVAEQGQLQFLAERRERLDIPDGKIVPYAQSGIYISVDTVQPINGF